MPTSPLTLTQTIQAAPSAVYRALTTPGGLLDWLAQACDVDARLGGRFYVWAEKGPHMLGKISALEKDSCLALDLLAPTDGHLSITLTPQNDTTLLTFEQTPFATDADQDTARIQWTAALANLQAVLETGLDPRFYNRPMMGILISGRVEKETQERLHLALDYGILLGGTLPGMDAERLGLADGDILVEMEGQPIKNYEEIGQVLEGRTAGETIHLAWYRGKARHEADMILSGRPHPHLPATFAELAEEARQIYASLDGELTEILANVSETAAEYRPLETEWNAKEIIAHLIHTERAMQIWLVNAVDGAPFTHWTTNNHNIVKSIVDVTPTLPELLDELRRAEAQTVALLQRLPEETVTHKGTFHNIVTTLNQEGLSVHTRLHFETIKRLVDEVMK
ncbi:MAG: SRPBCC domain-containing protein [Anaerolineales bacterium]|nr:SRPBCC domain-containing protein [Anaerolineales bacterium]